MEEQVVVADGAKEGVSRTNQEAWEELLRYPVVLDAVDDCQVCGQEDGPPELLECEMVGRGFRLASSRAALTLHHFRSSQCENAFHGPCLTPPIIGIPEGTFSSLLLRSSSCSLKRKELTHFRFRRRVVLPQVLVHGRRRGGEICVYQQQEAKSARREEACVALLSSSSSSPSSCPRR